jgi:hypothetical protein
MALSELLLENDTEQRRKLKKRLEAGTKHTRALTSGSWFVKRDGEGNAGIHRPIV